jgi:hypothetical protein
MKKLPPRLRPRALIISASFYACPSLNSSIANGAWSSAAFVRPVSTVKSFDTFDLTAITSLNKPLVLELARCEYIVARENTIVLGNSGTGKTHACLALGLVACQRGFSVAFFTAAGFVHQLMEARDERRLLKLQAQLAAVKPLIIDELGYVPLSQTGAELLFSQRHERGSTIALRLVSLNREAGRHWMCECKQLSIAESLADPERASAAALPISFSKSAQTSAE